MARAIRTKRWKYCVEAPGLKGGEASGSDHYVESELYDLEYDPYELTNLIGQESHRAACDVLKERLLQRMQEAGEEPPTIENAPAIQRFQRRVTQAEAES